MKTKKQILLLIVLSIVLVFSILIFTKFFYYFQVENLFEHKASKWITANEDVKLEYIYNDILDTVSLTGMFRGKNVTFNGLYFIDIVSNEVLFEIETKHIFPNKLELSIYELDNKTRTPVEIIVLRRTK